MGRIPQPSMKGGALGEREVGQAGTTTADCSMLWVLMDMSPNTKTRRENGRGGWGSMCEVTGAAGGGGGVGWGEVSDSMVRCITSLSAKALIET